MTNMILLFSHKLTQSQIKDAKESLNVSEFIYLPDYLQEKFSQIPTDLETLETFLLPIKSFLVQNYQKGDYVLIQGDFGAVYNLVNFSNSLGLIPIYSTNKRVAKEEFVDNKLIKTSEFEHVLFRKYI